MSPRCGWANKLESYCSFCKYDFDNLTSDDVQNRLQVPHVVKASQLNFQAMAKFNCVFVARSAILIASNYEFKNQEQCVARKLAVVAAFTVASTYRQLRERERSSMLVSLDYSSLN
jgi:hypothetical protein